MSYQLDLSYLVEIIKSHGIQTSWYRTKKANRNESNRYHGYHDPKKVGKSQEEELNRLKLLLLLS